MTRTNSDEANGGGSTFRSNVIKDGVLRYPPTSVKVVIVGGGISGLFAALECWRKGHDVQVVERGANISEAGDVVGIGPSAWVSLQKYPSMFEEWNRISDDPVWLFCGEDGRPVAPPSEYEYNSNGVAQHVCYPLRIKPLMVRSQLAEMLAGQCKRLGIPIQFNTPIVDYEEDGPSKRATAMTTDGQRFSGDVVIAADGIGTKSHKIVLGEEVRAISTGFIIYRLKCPVSRLANAPAFQQLYQQMGRPEIRLGPAGQLHYALTMAEDYVSLGLSVKDNGTATESWSATVSRDNVLSEHPEFIDCQPAIADIIRNAPDNSIVRWPLVMRNPQPKWTSPCGRIVQIGDSAHSFLPTSGNGATMAIEDALSIAECLRLGAGDVGTATQVHQLLRYQRASVVQQTGMNNRSEINNKMSNDVLRQGKWIWTHNPEQYATTEFYRARSCLESGAEFHNTNLPPGYVWTPWTIEEEMAKEKAGVHSQDLKKNGYWGVV
ncbi:monooxygenase [Aspergillus piperis CBS 112811]|uniref:Monooxygenase n=1 Tax=Aspergillus piperis CBS 112811 TaxID=1448313 RepID=A0A8G1QY82_9EURO|nr:monooxygenase [Aspergillus piperis CBS 112811]RAH55757.1 monooxygenase [Aspergillus piperis CBS 112811]